MGAIHFRGSKERLQRIVARSGGKWLPERQFEMNMRDSSKRLPFLTFSFQCRWESTDGGIQITYAVRPTIPTLIGLLLAFAFFAFPLLSQNAPASSYVIPALLILVFLAQMRNCITAFRELFSTPTT